MGEVQQLFQHVMNSFEAFLSQAQTANRIDKYVLEVVVSGQSTTTPPSPGQHALLCSALTTLLHTLQKFVGCYCSEGLKDCQQSKHEPSPSLTNETLSTQKVYSAKHPRQQQQQLFDMQDIKLRSNIGNEEEKEAIKITQLNHLSPPQHPTTKETEAANVLMNLSGKASAGDRLSQSGLDAAGTHLSLSPHHIIHSPPKDSNVPKDLKFLPYSSSVNIPTSLTYLNPDMTLKPVIYSCPDEVPQINEKDLLSLATQVLCQVCGRQCEDLVELHEHVLASHNPSDPAHNLPSSVFNPPAPTHSSPDLTHNPLDHTHNLLGTTQCTHIPPDPTHNLPNHSQNPLFNHSHSTHNLPNLIHNPPHSILNLPKVTLNPPNPDHDMPNPALNPPHKPLSFNKKPRLHPRDKEGAVKKLMRQDTENVAGSRTPLVASGSKQATTEKKSKRSRPKRTSKNVSNNSDKGHTTHHEENVIKVESSNGGQEHPLLSPVGSNLGTSYIIPHSHPKNTLVAIKSDALHYSDQDWLKCQSDSTMTELVVAGSDLFEDDIQAVTNDPLAIAVASSQIKTVEAKVTIFVCVECSCGFTESKGIGEHVCLPGRALVHRHSDGSVTIPAHHPPPSHLEGQVWYFPEFVIRQGEGHEGGQVVIHTESGCTLHLHTSHHPDYLSEQLISFRCPVCASEWNSLGGFLNHLSAGPCIFRCPDCPLAYTTHAKLSAHRSIFHPGLQERTCPMCQAVFEKRHQRNKHLKTKCSQRHVCVICNRPVKNEYNLRVHMKSHQERSHKCTECGAAFHRRTVLVRHMMRHSGIKPHACSQCPTRFYTRQHLQTHLDRHDGHKRFSCDICSCAYYSKQKRDAHRAKVHACSTPLHSTHPDPTLPATRKPTIIDTHYLITDTHNVSKAVTHKALQSVPTS